MIKNSKLKRTSLSFLLILCFFTLFSAGVFADNSTARPIYFKYRDGVVRDGSVGDRAGIIGDEDEAEEYYRHHRRTLPTSSLIGGNNNSINDNVLPRDNYVGDMIRSSDNATSSSDEGAASTVFWGIVIVMIVAAAIILLIVLMTPKSTRKNK